MTRRKTLLAIAGGLGVVSSGYAWSERRGLTRADVVPEPAPDLSAQMSSLLMHASLAPSGHNTQPWSVRKTNSGLIVGSDPARWLPRVDPDNREMAIAIGAFLENLLIAAPGHGYRPEFSVTAANPGDKDLILVELARTQETGQSALERLRLRRTIRTGQLRQ